MRPIATSQKIAPTISSKRGRQPRHDQLGDLGALDVGAAEIAAGEAREIAPVLDDEGLVEAELAADVLDRLGRRAAAGDLPHRIGRQQVEQREGDQRHAEQDQQRLDQPAAEIGDHARPLCVGSRMSRSASPTRLKASASARIAAPGKNTSQGAAWK